VPLFYNNEVAGVLDVDSEELAKFDDTDAEYLQQVIKLINFK
jgi:GAF domain-containing protein